MSLFTLRGAYTKSLGGVSEDENYRLEQTQVAGFPQTFRSLIPESVVGSVCAPEYETYAAALDLKFPSRTYVGIQAQQLNSDVNRTVGCLVLSNGSAAVCPLLDPGTAPLPRGLHRWHDQPASRRLLCRGRRLHFNQARLNDTYPKVPLKGFNTTQQADLQGSAATFYSTILRAFSPARMQPGIISRTSATRRRCPATISSRKTSTWAIVFSIGTLRSCSAS